VQLSLQVSEQAEPGGRPEQACPPVQAELPLTYRQPFSSWAQVAIVKASWHSMPGCSHALALQLQLAREASAVPSTRQLWWGPQLSVATQAVQPLAWTWQLCTPLVVHSLEPSLQTF
jgi:hypothetical protein